MSSTNESRPLAELLGGLASDISGLFRKEVELAKAEASETVSHVLEGIEWLLAGAVLALAALGVFLAAVVTLLAAFFAAQGLDALLSSALSAGVVTLIVGLIAWGLVSRGRKALRAKNFTMKRTASSLGRDADVVKERL